MIELSSYVAFFKLTPQFLKIIRSIECYYDPLHVHGQAIGLSLGNSVNNGPWVSRRDFLKLMGAAGIGMSFASFVDWSKFLTRANAQIPQGSQANNATIPANPNAEQTADKTAIRPFCVNVPEEKLVELRKRIEETRCPERETVTDASQGVQLATTPELVCYWATYYDWRNVEAKLNALPQFLTEIDGLDIQYNVKTWSLPDPAEL